MQVRSVIGVAALAATLTVAPYPAAYADSTAHVVGGGPVSSAPWAAGLYSGDSFFCSASIIASHWVLTAQHCVAAGTPDSVRIDDVRRGQGTQVGVADVVTAPHADLALLRLGREVDTAYAPLASTDPPAGATVEIYGWGTTSQEDEVTLSDVLKRGIMRVVNIGADAYDGPSVHAVKVDAVAGYGDSGGPMFYQGTVVGACSWGDLEYTTSDYGSVAANRDWIRATAGV